MSQSLNKLYIQSLDQPLPPQDSDDPALFESKIARLSQLIDQVDAVVVGIGSGLSTAAGYDFYHGTQLFEDAFGPYRHAHGFTTLFDGLYHAFSSNEEQWAFYAAVAHFVDTLPLGAPYAQLAELLAHKDYFVLTTNVDGQVPRAFKEGSYWLFQGDLRLGQCSQPCTDELFDLTHLWEKIQVETINGRETPILGADDLPRCSHCHRLLLPWVRDRHFLEGSLWQEQKASYEQFLHKHLLAPNESFSVTPRVLFLELGVSSMTPSIIKMPFWEMTTRNPSAFYVDVNCGEASLPQQLGDRAMVVTADLAQVIQALG